MTDVTIVGRSVGNERKFRIEDWLGDNPQSTRDTRRYFLGVTGHKDHGLAGGCEFGADARPRLAGAHVDVNQRNIGLIKQIKYVLPASSHAANVEAGRDHGVLYHHRDEVLIFDDEHFLTGLQIFHVARSCKGTERSSCFPNSRGNKLGSVALNAGYKKSTTMQMGTFERLNATIDAIDRELGKGQFHYRYSGAETEEGCFLACSG